MTCKDSKVEEQEALGHWNALYTDLQKSASPAPEDESVLAAELLAPRHLDLKQLIEKFMGSGTDPAWMKESTKLLGSHARRARDRAIDEMEICVEALKLKYEKTATEQDLKRIDQLTSYQDLHRSSPQN
jgi:hypothetical protein